MQLLGAICLTMSYIEGIYRFHATLEETYASSRQTVRGHEGYHSYRGLKKNTLSPGNNIETEEIPRIFDG